MKLFASVNSPYARKCRVVLREKGLLDKCEEVLVNSLENPPELLAVNPLGKVPALVAEGHALCDSTIICEYLDGLKSPPFIPGGKPRFEVLSIAALADGIMDLAVDWTLQKRRDPIQQWPDWMLRRQEGILRTLGTLVHTTLLEKTTLHQGHINTACALAYVNFRHPELDWQTPYPDLAEWLAEFERRDAMQQTMPKA